jgi:mono/diheme cytochrome c family protein
MLSDMSPVLRFAALALLATASAACAPLHATAHLDDDSSPRQGLLYATANCASCHAVNAGQMQSPVISATPFQAVANTPGMTATALNVWLHTPHQAMPDFIIPNAAVDDLSAYILSLKQNEHRVTH